MAVGSPFGSRTRTRLLFALELLGQSYARELGRLLETPFSVVQKGLASLERDGLIAGRLFGRTRLFELNSGYVAASPLRALVATLASADADLRKRVRRLRPAAAARRPAPPVERSERPARSRSEREDAGREFEDFVD